MRVKTSLVFARIQIREESGLGLCWSRAPGDGVVGCDGLVWVGMGLDNDTMTNEVCQAKSLDGPKRWKP